VSDRQAEFSAAVHQDASHQPIDHPVDLMLHERRVALDVPSTEPAVGPGVVVELRDRTPV
jgi:hypothetical protein